MSGIGNLIGLLAGGLFMGISWLVALSRTTNRSRGLSVAVSATWMNKENSNFAKPLWKKS